MTTQPELLPSREEFERFATELGYDVGRDGSVYASTEVQLMWVGYRRCKEQHCITPSPATHTQGEDDTKAWLIRMIETCEDAGLRKAFAERLAALPSHQPTEDVIERIAELSASRALSEADIRAALNRPVGGEK